MIDQKKGCHVLVAIICLSIFNIVSAQLKFLKTFAGTVSGFGGDTGVASLAKLNIPFSAIADSVGNMFIADRGNHRIRKISSGTNIITTIAGAGSVNRFGGDSGPAISSYLFGPGGVWVSTQGVLYIADTLNHRIRMISTAGIISTIAGMNVRGYSSGDTGDGGPATSATFWGSFGLVGDTSGNIYFSSFYYSLVRKISNNGIVSAYAGTGGTGYSISHENILATLATLNYPRGLTIDSMGNLYIADKSNYRIRKVAAATQIITTIAGSGSRIFADGPATTAGISLCQYLWVDSLGQIFFTDEDAYVVRKVNTQGIVSTIAGKANMLGSMSTSSSIATSSFIGYPRSITGDTAGNIYVFIDYNNYIAKISSTGYLSVAVGSGSGVLSVGAVATMTGIGDPYSLYLNTDGTLYMGDCSVNAISKINIFVPNSLSTMVTGPTTASIYLDGDGGPVSSAMIGKVEAVWVDSTASLYFIDASNYRIRKIDAAGIITSICGSGLSGMNGANTDGVAATSSYLNNPSSVFGDSIGKIYISDSSNGLIRNIASNGIIRSVAGGGLNTNLGDGGLATVAYLNNPIGLYVTSVGNIYIADSGNHRIRIVGVSGIISTIAGNGKPLLRGDDGPATASSLKSPHAIWVSTDGTILIADTENHRIRRIDASTRIISSLVGKGVFGYASYGGDNGAASSAYINYPDGVYVDTNSRIIYFTDSNNDRIRKVSLLTNIISTHVGTGECCSTIGASATATTMLDPQGLAVDTLGNIYYTQFEYIRKVSPTGIVTHIAGNGDITYNGDGIPAINAAMGYPQGIHIASGIIYFSDNFLYRIRTINNFGIINTFAGTGTYGSPTDGVPATSSMIGNVYGIYSDSAGKIYFSDSSYNRIRMVNTFGILSTFAGTGVAGYSSSHEGILATLATLNYPCGIWIDSNGNMFITDSSNHRVRKISVGTNIITTIAGSGVAGLGGDGEALLAGTLFSPNGIWGDSSGILYIADSGNHRIRKLDTIYDKITSIVGSDAYGRSGLGTENVPGLSSYLNNPRGVTTDTAGNVYIVDSSSNKVRQLFDVAYPTSQPTSEPTQQPSRVPSAQPTAQPSLQPTSQPSRQPSTQPTVQPFSQPSRQPTSQPTRRPTDQPTRQPSRQPSTQPMRHPTTQPTIRPTRFPTAQPSTQPSKQPTMQPSAQPSHQPITHPTRQPSSQPSRNPTIQPSLQPSCQPSTQPSSHPTQPTSQPSSQPSGRPSHQPTLQPTTQPSAEPSCQPSNQPTSQPSTYPTSHPSDQPSSKPSFQPTLQPSSQPTEQPSSRPTIQPTIQPTMQPISQPSGQPSKIPSSQPSSQPTLMPSSQPTDKPTCQPSSCPTNQPTSSPSTIPSTQPISNPTGQPSSKPSIKPSQQPSSYPSMQPTAQPSSMPSFQPTVQPSSIPSDQPNQQPTGYPSRQPTSSPTLQPTAQPSLKPSAQPSFWPSNQPTSRPTYSPTDQPSSQPSSLPTSQPTKLPTVVPTEQPSIQPSSQPTIQPSKQPTCDPSQQPSSMPTAQPSGQPSQSPSCQPVNKPSRQPSSIPTVQPSSFPSVQPTLAPTLQPIAQPSAQPSSIPTDVPTTQPTKQPSAKPSAFPTIQPISNPTIKPTSSPSLQPFAHPSVQPSIQPTSVPTSLPSIQPSSKPSKQPTACPSHQPTTKPSHQPSEHPSDQPSSHPSAQPRSHPSIQPTIQPTQQPSEKPTCRPSNQPTINPSNQPLGHPTCQPLAFPSTQPSSQPSLPPTVQPTMQPSESPSVYPPNQPSQSPSIQPSHQPTTHPTSQPTSCPTKQPTIQSNLKPSATPTSQPKSKPTTQPTCKPSNLPSNKPTRSPTSQPTMNPSIQPIASPTGKPSSTPSSNPSSCPTSHPSNQPFSHPSGHPTSQPTGRPSLFDMEYTNIPTSKQIKLISAIFDDSGLFITFTLSTAVRTLTDQVFFPCHDMFGYDTMMTSSGNPIAFCRLSKGVSLVSFDIEHFQADQKITLLLSAPIQALCYHNLICNVTTVKASAITVQPPRQPIIPVLDIKYNRMVYTGSCLWMDLTSTTGNAGKQWKRVSAFVAVAPSNRTTGQPWLEQQLLDRFTTERPFLLEWNMFANLKDDHSEAVQITQTLTLCNVFDKCASSAIDVIVVYSAIALKQPLLIFAGPMEKTVSVSTSTSFAIMALTQDCAYMTELKPSTVQWRVWTHNTTSRTSTLSIRSTNTDKMRFTLPPHILYPGERYELEAVMMSSTQSSASVFLEVQTANPIAVISPNLVAHHLQVHGNNALRLDASKSVAGNDYSISTALSYRWNCTTDNEDMPCPLNILMDGPTGIVVSISNSSSTAGKPSLMTLTVSQALNGEALVDSATMLITIVEAKDPTISIFTWVQPGKRRVNVNERIVVPATIYSPTTRCVAQWSVNIDGATISIGNIASTATRKLVDVGKQTPMELVLLPLSLPSIADASYPFTLSCGSSFQTIVISTNVGPSKGKFIISPDLGIESQTMFNMLATGWLDLDLPLSYQFAYRTVAKTPSSGYLDMVIRSRLEWSYAYSKMPAGDMIDSSKLNCVLTVFDSLDASTLSVATITVTAVNGDTLLQTLMTRFGNSSILNAGEVEMSMDELQQIVALTSTALNRVNCTAAPKDCHTRNRYSCSTTDHTCGKCFTGYVGEEGDSNSICLSLDLFKTIAGAESTSKTCTTDADCFTWEACDQVSMQCGEKAKTCLRDCSGKGICHYIDVSSGVLYSPSERCTVFMIDCVAVCDCQTGFSGNDCSLTSEQMEIKQALRSYMLDGLGNFVLKSNNVSNFATAESISSSVSLLQAIVSVPEEISSSIASKVSEIALQLVQQAIETKTLLHSNLLAVLDAADTSLAATSTSLKLGEFDPKSIYKAMDVVDTFGDLLFQQQAAGKNATNYIYNNFRLSSQAFTFVVSPLTAMEQSKNTNATATVSAALNSSDVASVKLAAQLQQLQAIELKQKFWRQNDSIDKLSSNILIIKTANVNNFVVTVQKRKKRSQSDTSIAFTGLNLTTHCDNNRFFNESLICPGSNYELVNSCKGMEGVLTSYCPVPTIGCLSLSLLDQTIDPHSSCVVLNETLNEITCRCSASLKPVINSRSVAHRRLSFDKEAMDDILYQSGALTMGLMIYYVANEFQNTFNAAPNAFSSVRDTKRVLIVLAMFISLWAIGFIFIGIVFVRQQEIKATMSKKVSQDTFALKSQFTNRRHRSSIRKSLHLSVATLTPEQLRAKLSNYVFSVIPAVFTNSATGSIWKTIKHELSRHHVYWKLWARSPTDRLPVLMVCQILTSHTLTMFLLSILYDLQGPDDDGSCEGHLNELACLRRKSLFDSTKTYCKWTYNAVSTTSTLQDVSDLDGMMLCSYHEIDISFEVMNYCAVVGSVFTALLMRLVDYCFRILSSPLEQAIIVSKHKVQPESANPTPRTMSNKMKHVSSKFIPEETHTAHNQALLSFLSISDPY